MVVSCAASRAREGSRGRRSNLHTILHSAARENVCRCSLLNGFSLLCCCCGWVVCCLSRLQFPEAEGEEAPEAVAVGIRSENKFYRMDGEFDEKTVAEFVDAYLKGSLKVCLLPPCAPPPCHWKRPVMGFGFKYLVLGLVWLVLSFWPAARVCAVRAWETLPTSRFDVVCGGTQR